MIEIRWDDAERTLALIRRYFPSQEKFLLDGDGELSEIALLQLSQETLKLIGVRCYEVVRARGVRECKAAVCV